MNKEKNELQKLYQTIQQKAPKKDFHSDEIPFEKIIEGFKDIEQQDCPDGILVIDDTVYIIEHFMVSIYRNKSGEDKKQRATTGRYDRYFTKHPEASKLVMDLEGSLKQLQTAIQQSIKKHMESYPYYLEKAKKLYPNNLKKFIFVVEDQSEIIINEDGIGILGIQELVSLFLEHEYIDAAISYNTSTRGDFIEAIDRKAMTILYPNLIKIEDCILLSLIEKVSILSLDNSKWLPLKEYLMKCMEKMCITESIIVEKIGGSGCDEI